MTRSARWSCATRADSPTVRASARDAAARANNLQRGGVPWKDVHGRLGRWGLGRRRFPRRRDLGRLGRRRRRRLGRHLASTSARFASSHAATFSGVFVFSRDGFDLRDRLDVGDALGDERAAAANASSKSKSSPSASAAAAAPASAAASAASIAAAASASSTNSVAPSISSSTVTFTAISFSSSSASSSASSTRMRATAPSSAWPPGVRASFSAYPSRPARRAFPNVTPAPVAGVFAGAAGRGAVPGVAPATDPRGGPRPGGGTVRSATTWGCSRRRSRGTPSRSGTRSRSPPRCTRGTLWR